MSTVPPFLAHLIDDAAVFPPGNAPLPAAIAAHREHRDAWYADLVGPLLVPASRLTEVDGPLAVGVIGDVGPAAADGSLAALDKHLSGVRRHMTVRQLEMPVALRGEDPVPGARALVERAADWDLPAVYAEIPLTIGCLAALDELAESRTVRPKFRTGGLAAELFPSPPELAAMICACRDRGLSFKLTAGLHHALRHTDSATGFTHHGFLNVLVGAVIAAAGADPRTVADTLASRDESALVTAALPHLTEPRPLWMGFGTCSVTEPLDDLRTLGFFQGGIS